jgi:hypothetical protein
VLCALALSMDAAGIRLVENLRELKMSMLCTQAQAKPKKRGGVASFGVHADPSLRHKLDGIVGCPRAKALLRNVEVRWFVTRRALGESIDHGVVVATLQCKPTRWGRREEVLP